MGTSPSLPSRSPTAASKTTGLDTASTPIARTSAPCASLGSEDNLQDSHCSTAIDDSYGAPVPDIVAVTLDPASPRATNIRDSPNKERMYEFGYDSDGEAGPWTDMVKEEGPQMFDEDCVGDVVGLNTVVTNLDDATNVTNEASDDKNGDIESPPPNKHVDIEDEDLLKMKNEELKAELRGRGLPVGGNRETLRKRLRKALNDKVIVKCSKLSKKKFASRDGGEKKKKNSNHQMKFFSDDAYWKELFPIDEPVVEPENPTFNMARAPTVEECNATHVPVKYNFSHEFERPSFGGVVKKVKRLKNGKIRKNADGNAIHDDEVRREKGCVNPEFIQKFNLSPSTTPSQYADIFLPLKTNIIRTKEYPSFQLFTK